MKNANQFQKLALLFALSSMSFSAIPNTVPGHSLTPATEKSIATYFKFPRVLIPYTESNTPVKVEVLFTTDTRGRVNYALAKTADRGLKQEIERQFYNINLPQRKQNVVHRVVLDFRYLDSK